MRYNQQQQFYGRGMPNGQGYSIMNARNGTFQAPGVQTNLNNNRYGVNQMWQNNANKSNTPKPKIKAPTKKKDTSSGFPPALVKFVQRCFGTLSEVVQSPLHQKKDKAQVHTELKAIIAKAKAEGKLQTMDWANHAFPAYLQTLVDLNKRKRKREDEDGSKRRRGVSPASFGNSFYGSDACRNKKPKKMKLGKQRKGKKKNNFETQVNNQANEWFAEADSAVFNSAMARRSKRFGRDSLKERVYRPTPFDWKNHVVVKSGDFESAKIVGTNKQVLKDFFRLTREARPNEVRTKDTCRKALMLIKGHWKRDRDYRWCENQLKSLRQDLKVQHIRDALTIDTYETHGRMCLEVSDFSEYNQCQTALRFLYKDNPDNAQNAVEFLTYRILYFAVIKDHAGLTKVIGQSFNTKDKAVKLAVKISLAMKSGNYFQLFKLYSKLPKLAQNMVNQVKEKMRFRALALLASNHGQPYPVSKIQEFLGFGSVEECLFYLKESNVMLTKDRKKMDVKKSKGKVKEYVHKSVDDQHGVTHGSLVGSAEKTYDADTTISHFLRANSGD